MKKWEQKTKTDVEKKFKMQQHPGKTRNNFQKGQQTDNK